MTDGERQDAERWQAVEEATELLIDGQTEEAVVALRDVVARDPRNAYAFHYLGTSLFELERYEVARDAYRAAIALSPDYLGAHLGLSHSLRRLREPQQALDAAEEARRRFPSDGDAMYACAMAHAMLGARREAQKLLHKFLATQPELEVQLEVRGMIQMLAKGLEGDPFELA